MAAWPPPRAGQRGRVRSGRGRRRVRDDPRCKDGGDPRLLQHDDGCSAGDRPVQGPVLRSGRGIARLEPERDPLARATGSPPSPMPSTTRSRRMAGATSHGSRTPTLLLLVQTGRVLASKGATGAPGPPGPAGIATGFSTVSASSVILDQAQVLTPVMTTPAVATAGQYYVNASIMLVVAQGDTVTCIAAVNGNRRPARSPQLGRPPIRRMRRFLSPSPSAFRPAVSSRWTAPTTRQMRVTSFYDGGLTATLIGSDNPSAAAQHASTPATVPRALGGTARYVRRRDRRGPATAGPRRSLRPASAPPG